MPDIDIRFDTMEKIFAERLLCVEQLLDIRIKRLEKLDLRIAALEARIVALEGK